MKKLLFTLFALLLICSVCLKAQENQSKLNQVELSKKFTGTWQILTDKDTVSCFEMSQYKNAVLETMYFTVKGTKIITGAIIFNYESLDDNFKGYWTNSKGTVAAFTFKFNSEKEAVWEMVENFKTNKIKARNTFTFVNPDHANGEHYNADLVKINSSKWVRTGSGH
jgi:hypothetical protein